jgi:hypothetical protein
MLMMKNKIKPSNYGALDVRTWKAIKGHLLYKTMTRYYQMMIPTIAQLMNFRKI